MNLSHSFVHQRAFSLSINTSMTAHAMCFLFLKTKIPNIVNITGTSWVKDIYLYTSHSKNKTKKQLLSKQKCSIYISESFLVNLSTDRHKPSTVCRDTATQQKETSDPNAGHRIFFKKSFTHGKHQGNKRPQTCL